MLLRGGRGQSALRPFGFGGVQQRTQSVRGGIPTRSVRSDDPAQASPLKRLPLRFWGMAGRIDATPGAAGKAWLYLISVIGECHYGVPHSSLFTDLL